MSKNKIGSTINRTRILCEITSPAGAHEVVATSAKEVKFAIAHRLPNLSPYSVNAVTHLVYDERADVMVEGWRVRWVGLLNLETGGSPAVAAKKVRGKKGQAALQVMPHVTLGEADSQVQPLDPEPLF